jgi:hypothetical protein
LPCTHPNFGLGVFRTQKKADAPDSAEQLHARSARRILIEGDSVWTVRRVAAALNQAVGKVNATGAEISQGLPDDFC